MTRLGNVMHWLRGTLGRRDSWRAVSLVIVGMVAALLVTVGAVTQEVDTAVRFAVNGNGVTGELSYTVAADGSVDATLLGAPAHGLLAGRHLVLRRHAGSRDELWDGWLSDASTGRPTLVAGTVTVTVTDGSAVTVLPWFGQAPSGEGPAEQAAAPAGSPAETPRSVETPAGAPTPVPPRLLPGPPGVAPPALGASATTTPWSLDGRWSTPRGVATIAVDGSRISATLADGRTVSGRMTGPASLVLGLGLGCCKGDLEGPDQISWSDGTVWYRGR